MRHFEIADTPMQLYLDDYDEISMDT